MFLSAITKNLNWEILNMILVTFRRWDKVRDEKFWYDVCSLKIRFLEGIHDKPIYRGDCLKRGAWTACRFNGCVGGGGVDTPMHTMYPEDCRWQYASVGVQAMCSN